MKINIRNNKEFFCLYSKLSPYSRQKLLFQTSTKSWLFRPIFLCLANKIIDASLAFLCLLATFVAIFDQFLPFLKNLVFFAIFGHFGYFWDHIWPFLAPFGLYITYWSKKNFTWNAFVAKASWLSRSGLSFFVNKWNKSLTRRLNSFWDTVLSLLMSKIRNICNKKE